MANDQGTFLAYKNWAEHLGAVITTDEDEQGDRIASNLATRESDDVWRFETLTDTSATVEIDFGQDRDVDLCTLQFPRGTYPGVNEDNPAFSPSDTIRYYLTDEADNILWDGLTEPSEIISGYMTHWKRTDVTYSARKLKIDLNAMSRSTPDFEFCDVGMAGAWPVFDPRVGFAYPAGFDWIANTGSNKTTAGRLYTARFEPLRRWSFVFDTVGNDESMEFSEMIRYSGGARQIFARRGDLPAGKDAMHCLIENSREIQSVTPEIRGLTMALKEFI